MRECGAPDTNFKVIDRRSPETRARVAEMPERNDEQTLAPCPFCGKAPEVLSCDEGPDAGGSLAQLSCCEGDHAVFVTSGDTDHAASIWNRRVSIPDSMNGVVRWHRYDGTEETLPEEGKPVLLAKALNYGDQFVYRHDDGWAILERQTGYYPEYPRKEGDLWAYLPCPPEIGKDCLCR